LATAAAFVGEYQSLFTSGVPVMDAYDQITVKLTEAGQAAGTEVHTMFELLTGGA
jgi:hypothetical protein